jgi:hypothetical protein
VLENKPNEITPKTSRVGQNEDSLCEHDEKSSQHRKIPEIEISLYAAKYRRLATESWSAIGILPNFLFQSDLPSGLWEKLCKPFGSKFTSLGELGESLTQRCLNIRQTKNSLESLSIQEQAQRFLSEGVPLLEEAQYFIRKAGALIPQIRSQLPQYAKAMFGGMLEELPEGNDHLFHSSFKTFRTLNAGLIAQTVPETESGTIFNLSGFLTAYKVARGNHQKGENNQGGVDQNGEEQGESSRAEVVSRSTDTWVIAPPLRTSGIIIEMLDEIELISERIKRRVAHELSQAEWDLSNISALPSQQQELFPLLTTDSLVALEIIGGSTLQASFTVPLASPQIALEVAHELSTICSKYSPIADSIRGTFSTDSEASAEQSEHVRIWLNVSFKESSEEGEENTALFSTPPQTEPIHPFSNFSEALVRVPLHGEPYRILLLQESQSQVLGVPYEIQSQIDQIFLSSNTFSLACISAEYHDQGEENEDGSPKNLRIHLLEEKSFKDLGRHQVESQVVRASVRQRLLHSYGLESAHRAPQCGTLYRTPPFLSIQSEMLCNPEISLELQSLLGKIGVGTLDLTPRDKQFVLATLKSLSEIADKIHAALPEGKDAKEYRLSYSPPRMVLVQNGRILPVPANIMIEDPAGHTLYSGELNGVDEDSSIVMVVKNTAVLKTISGVFFDACAESFRRFDNLDVAYLYNHLSSHRVRVTKSLFDTMYELAKSFEELDLKELTADRLFSQLVAKVEWKEIFEVAHKEDGVKLLYQSDRPMKDRKVQKDL